MVKEVSRNLLIAIRTNTRWNGTRTAGLLYNNHLINALFHLGRRVMHGSTIRMYQSNQTDNYWDQLDRTILIACLNHNETFTI